MMISTFRVDLPQVAAAGRARRGPGLASLFLAVWGLALTLHGCASPAPRARTMPGATLRAPAAGAKRSAPPAGEAVPNDLDPAEAFSHRRPTASPRDAASTASASAPGSWTGRGSSNQAGRTQVTAVSGDGQSLLIGTSGGNIFSGTAQSGWQPRADGLDMGILDIGVKHLLVTPGAPEVWLAASLYGEVRYSIDGGASWSAPGGMPQLYAVFRAVHDGGSPSTIYLLGLTSSDQGLLEGQIFRSHDGGQTFTGLATFPFADGPLGFAGHDLWTSRVASGPLYVLLQTGQLLISTDQGATFSPLGTAGPGNNNMAVLGGSEAGSPTLYAILGLNFQNWTVYASDDGGKTWQQRFALGGIFYSGIGGIGTSMHNPKLVVFGGTFAYRSTNGGRTFSQVPTNSGNDPLHLLHVDVDGIQMAAWQGGEALFINTDGGTYMSLNDGATFQNITFQDFPDSQYYNTYSNPKNPNQVAAGAQDQGLQISQPGPGAMAFDQVYAGDFGSLTSSSGDFKNVFAASRSALIFMPDPNQALTEGIYFSTPPFTGRKFLPVMVADPADSTSLYVAGDHIWYEQHADQPGGPTPVQLPQDFSRGQGDYLTALAISPADASHWYAVSQEGWAWASHDHGVTWASSPPPEPGYFSWSAVLASAQDPLTAYAGGLSSQGVIYKTADGGATWNPMSNGLSFGRVEGLAFDAPATQNLYAATDTGPYGYDAGSSTWINLLGAGTGAPLTRYVAVESLPAAGIVRFATYGRGVWDYSPTGTTQPPPPPPPPTVCTAGPNTLCLVAGRFQVQATWQNQFNSTSGQALAIPRTDESGFLGFTDPTNVELIVKILDLNGVYKVFYGELTDLHFTLTVSDTLTGTVKTYTNTPGDCGAIDEVGFPQSLALRTAPAASGRTTPAAPAPVTARAAVAAMTPRDAAAPLATLAQPAAVAAGTCRPGSGTLCLMNRRFALSMQWTNTGNGTSGAGSAVPLTGDLTGAFFFTDAGDLELVVKILDLGNRIAVYYGTLSDLEYTLTVTDTRSGAVKSYHNAAGNYCGGLDNSAFTP